MEGIGLEAIGCDDVILYLEGYDGISENVLLMDCVEKEIEHMERVMCEENANAFYKTIQNLEVLVYEMRKRYDGWKKNDFK